MIMNIYTFLVSVIMARNSTCVKLHIICRCFSSLLLFQKHLECYAAAQAKGSAVRF